MKSTFCIRALWALALAPFAAPFHAHADVSGNLRAHYTFDQYDPDPSDGDAGLMDVSGNNIQAVRLLDEAAAPAWLRGTNASGPGFEGNSAFNGGDGLSDRSHLLVGNALNLVDARNESIRVPLGTAELGGSFSISAWHYLSPGATNASARYFVFEAADASVDISWGTPSQTATGGPLASLNYDAYLNNVRQGPNPFVNLSSFAWHNVVQTVSSDGTNSTLSVYVDGQLRLTTAPVATSLINFNALVFGRERLATTDDRDWDGMLDEIGVWTRALDQSDVTEIYNDGLNGTAIPEPASATLAALAGGWLLSRRNRRHA